MDDKVMICFGKRASTESIVIANRTQSLVMRQQSKFIEEPKKLADQGFCKN
ncbi:MAG: hypothetical protein ACLRR3_03900 [Eubacterium sp.]